MFIDVAMCSKIEDPLDIAEMDLGAYQQRHQILHCQVQDVPSS
jgi:hypothetical protein